MSKFTPELFIDIGETGAYYTLRETYLHETYIRGAGDWGGAVVNGVYQGTVLTEVRSFHHFNLSQDPQEAISKAQEASERLGVGFKACTVEDIQAQMRDIHRATKEQMAQRAAQEAAWRAEREAQRAERAQERLNQIKQGIVPFGQHKDKRISELPRSFISWLIKMQDQFESDSPMFHLAKEVATNYSHLAQPTPKDVDFGTIGQRVSINALVLKSHSFERPRFNASWLMETVYITTLIEDATQACLVVFSPSWHPKADSRISFKATVKDHKDYNGLSQTVLQRPSEYKTLD